MTADSLTGVFAARMGALLGPDFPRSIGLAVSGGGDSMAMLALAHDWARPMGVGLQVVTVDHGLRDASVAEAAMVAGECAALGHPHSTLTWAWDGQGNLQDAARRARRDQIGSWAIERGLSHVLFAHTRDDQAETVLMRLARGSGVEGVAAMAPATTVRRTDGGAWQLLRPLLDVARGDLRHHADTLHLPYVDDPSNDDPRFDRVRVRAALEHLSDLGITPEGLARTAHRMGRARVALAARAADIADRIQIAEPRITGHVLLDRDGFAPVERDTQLRLLAAALQLVTGAPYRPRAAALEALLDRIAGGGGGTLSGAQVHVGATTLRIAREYAAVAETSAPGDGTGVWDGQWYGRGLPGQMLRALGPDGWAQLGALPDDAPPHAAALSLPALFDGARLVACPGLGLGAPDAITLRRPVQRLAAFVHSR